MWIGGAEGVILLLIRCYGGLYSQLARLRPERERDLICNGVMPSWRNKRIKLE